MAELKSCPFCGGEAKICYSGTAISIQCEQCSAVMGRENKTICFTRGMLSFGNEKEAINAWNTRTPQKINHDSLCETETFKVGD